MASRKLESLVGTSNPQASADLQPLLNNSFFAQRAQQEIDQADAAAEAARIAAANHEDFTGITLQFAQVMSGLRNIAKKFPEVSKYTDAATQQVQLAMQGAGNQPVDASAASASTPGASAPAPAQAPLLAGTAEAAKGGNTVTDIPPAQRAASVPASAVPTPGTTGATAPAPDQSRGTGASSTPVAAQAPGTFSVSGSITPPDKGNGTVMQLSGAKSVNAMVDAQGNYHIDGLPNGQYTLTPQKPGVSFTPQSVPVLVNSYNQTGVNFGAA